MSPGPAPHLIPNFSPTSTIFAPESPSRLRVDLMFSPRTRLQTYAAIATTDPEHPTSSTTTDPEHPTSSTTTDPDNLTAIATTPRRDRHARIPIPNVRLPRNKQNSGEILRTSETRGIPYPHPSHRTPA